jgi:hypothetical protein
MAVADQVPTQSGFHAKSTGAEVLADMDLSRQDRHRHRRL